MEALFKQTAGTSATTLFVQPRRRLFLSILAKIFPGPKRGDKGSGERLAEPLLDLGGCHWPPRWSQGCLFPSRPSSSSSFPRPSSPFPSPLLARSPGYADALHISAGIC